MRESQVDEVPMMESQVDEVPTRGGDIPTKAEFTKVEETLTKSGDIRMKTQEGDTLVII
jgi:hypothetical protein